MSSQEPTAKSQEGAAMETADGHGIAFGVYVWVWDDLPPVPQLDLYRVGKRASDPLDIELVADTPEWSGEPTGRLRAAQASALFIFHDQAIGRGFGELLRSLRQEDDGPRPHRVQRNGVLVTLNGQSDWYGGYEYELADRVGQAVLVGWPMPPRRHCVAIYEPDGSYLCIAAANIDAKGCGR